MAGGSVRKEIRKQTDKQFSANNVFYVDSTHPFTDQGKAYAWVATEDTVIASITELGVHEDSGDHPTTILAGYEEYGQVTSLSVSSGAIKLYLE